MCDLLVGGDRAAPGHHGLQPAGRAAAALACGEGARPKVGRKPDGHARAGGDQRHALEGGAQAQQVVVRHRIDDGHADAVRAQRVDACPDGSLALCHRLVVDQPDPASGLRLQARAPGSGPVMGVSGWFCMPDSFSSTSPTKKWPLKTVRPLSGKAGVAIAEVGLQRVHQRFGHRADVALRRAVEGGAVLEVDLPRALRLQPGQGVERLGNGV
jgi:hypothetical protein